MSAPEPVDKSKRATIRAGAGFCDSPAGAATLFSLWAADYEAALQKSTRELAEQFAIDNMAWTRAILEQIQAAGAMNVERCRKRKAGQ